jgi:hypothetical protein
MHLTACGSRLRQYAGGFSVLEAVVAAGVLLLTITAVSVCVGGVVRAGARLDRTRDADAALQRGAERLRSLAFCAPSLPVLAGGPAASDLCTAVFPHASSWKNTADARYVATAGDFSASPGSFVTVSDDGGVEMRCTAWFLRGADGPRLSPTDLAGWDVETAEEPPAPALEVVLCVGSPGGLRSVRLVLGALAPSLASLAVTGAA